MTLDLSTRALRPRVRLVAPLLLAAVAAAPVVAERVSATGWLHMVANGEMRVFLVDDQGKAVRLVIDEALGRAYGGIRTLRGRRVTVSGISEAPETIRVQAIEILESGSRRP